MNNLKKYLLFCSIVLASILFFAGFAFINPAKAAPTVDLKISAGNGPVYVTAGDPSTISWTTTDNPDSCTASSNPLGIWTGSKTIPSGSEAGGAGLSTGTYIYTLTCSKVGFPDVSDSVTVFRTINLTINGSPSNNGLGGSISLPEPAALVAIWQTGDGPTSCVATGDWSGSKNISGGSQPLGTFSAGSYTFWLECFQGVLGIGADRVNVTVTVAPPPPPPPPPPPAPAGGLVPCGGAGQPACNFCHIFELIQRILNVFLFPIVPIIAALLFAIGGFMLFTAAGIPANLSKAKTIFFAAIIGLLIIYGSWLFIEMLLDSLGFVSFGGVGSWWKVECSIPIPVVVPAPFAHWKFDEGSGITASDSMGGPDATLVAAPADPAWVVGGKVGGALEFDGCSTCLPPTYDLVNLPFTLGSEPKFTVSAWIKSNNNKGESAVIGTSGSMDLAMGVQSPSAVVTYKLAPGFGGWADLYVPIASPIGSWHRLTFVYDDSAVVKGKYYYDGVSPGGLAQSSAPKDLAAGKPNWQLGAGYLDPYNGLIDEVKIWKQALTDAEVLAEFNSY